MICIKMKGMLIIKCLMTTNIKLYKTIMVWVINDFQNVIEFEVL